MKDHTVMHACGLEEYCDTKRQAFSSAKAHKKQCELNGSDKIFVDESLDGELNEKWWKF